MVNCSPFAALPGIRLCRISASPGGIKMYDVPVSMMPDLSVKLQGTPPTRTSLTSISQLELLTVGL